MNVKHRASVMALIVTYNHADYIREALASVIGQTEPVDSILVIDDGSTDGTCAEVMRVADPRVRLLTQPHRGIERLAETYAVGLEHCRADLVAVLEGDDRWPTTKLATQLPAFHDPHVVLAHGAYAVIGARGSVLRHRVAPSPEPPVGGYRALDRQLLASYIMPVTVIMRAAALRESGGFRQLGRTPHWDHPTFLSLAEIGKFSYTNEVVGIWRKHATSGTSALAGYDLDGVDLSLPLVLTVRERHRSDPTLPTPTQIGRSWSDAFGRQAWQVGRLLLVTRRYSEARALAWQGLRRTSSPGSRLRLTALLLAAALRIDLEHWARWLWMTSPYDELR